MVRVRSMGAADVHAVSVAAMQRIDDRAINRLGIPRLLLMDYAGLALARSAQTLSRRQRRRGILICSGSGYNGGDGLAAARHLHAVGCDVRVVLAAQLATLREEPAVFARIVRALEIPVITWGTRGMRDIERWMGRCGVVVDALLGIGTRGVVREPIASVIAWVNSRHRAVVAADLPSGLNGDTGEVQGVAVRATRTVTFGLPKRGCFVGEGPGHTGTLVVDAITLPSHLLQGQR